jgi:hypothetical protein
MSFVRSKEILHRSKSVKRGYPVVDAILTPVEAGSITSDELSRQ